MSKQEAHDLVVQVCREYRRSLPKTIQFYQGRSSNYSSGRYYPGGLRRRSRLHVTLGVGGNDHAETVLHETAHHLIARTSKGRTVGHPVRFWRLHYELCERYGVTPDHTRNTAYRTKAEDGRRKAIG